MTDPRPLVEGSGDPRLVGVKCTNCDHAMVTDRPACSACGGTVTEAAFGPGGQVWASTVVRIKVGDRTPPYALAYVDLHGGPRILAHLRGTQEAPLVGSEVRLVAPVDGDVMVEVVG